MKNWNLSVNERDGSSLGVTGWFGGAGCHPVGANASEALLGRLLLRLCMLCVLGLCSGFVNQIQLFNSISILCTVYFQILLN